MNRRLISLEIVKNLIKSQFPQFKKLQIKEVDVQGHDNRTFHLGDELLIRLPSAECYSDKVEIEQKWLPILAKNLSFQIPSSIAMGKPSRDYPFNWSIYKFIEGQSANTLNLNKLDLNFIALQLTQFLKELHKVDIAGAPIPGVHNFYRGANLKIYDKETRSAILNLKKLINADAALKLWEKALISKWEKSPVWIHGDLAPGNIIIKNNKLIGVIDFGGMAVGDPACDLVIAWTFLKDESRKIFKTNLALDSNTWMRAQGWALWKALISLDKIENKTSNEALAQKEIIENIIKDYD